MEEVFTSTTSLTVAMHERNLFVKVCCAIISNRFCNYHGVQKITEQFKLNNICTYIPKDYLGELTSVGVDAFLCPAMLLPAPPCGVLGTFFPAVLPYVPWNTMNFPAGIAPITKWSKEDTEAMTKYPTDDLAYKLVHSYCKDAEGLPLAVQVVARPYKDEQVLRLLRELEDGV